MNPTQCPLDETLARYSRGELDDTVAEDVNHHLESCELCLARLEASSKPHSLLAFVRETAGQNDTPPLLNQAINAVLTFTDGTRGLPKQIGDYSIRSQLGRGGMGQVFLAQHPRLDLQVAVKLLRSGFETERLKARFATECELLARLEHPNIAKVFDTGVTSTDQPYFVMEHVAGPTLTQYLLDESPSLNQRLELFQQLCRAVQHAHQKGIIHRDIKPSNVLVTRIGEQWVPKLIDFGVARGVEPQDTHHTEPGLIVGTLAYMSPEQTQDSAARLDTRTDIYSLGVLLYVLLTGKPPLAWLAPPEKSEWELLRLVRDAEPNPPSDHANLAYPNSRIRNELDWITLRALEKEPDRRYASADALAEDVERVLNDEPVQAAPPSRVYRARKFVRRNRAMMIAATLIMLTMSVGIAGTTWQMLRAWEAEAQANRDRNDATQSKQQAQLDRQLALDSDADARAFNTFLVKSLLEASRPVNNHQNQGRSITLLEAIDAAEPTIGTAFRNRPLAEAQARIAIGQTLREYGRFADAERQFRQAMELLVQLPERRVKVELLCKQGQMLLHVQNDQPTEAMKLYQELLPQFEELYGAESAECWELRYQHGVIRYGLREYQAAIAIFREVLANSLATLGPDADRTLNSLESLAKNLVEELQYPEALRIYDDLIPRMRNLRGPTDLTTLRATIAWGEALYAAGRPRETVTTLEPIVKKTHQLLGDEHLQTLRIDSALGLAYLTQKRHQDALPLLVQAHAVSVKQFGPTFSRTLNLKGNLAGCYYMLGDIDNALPLARDVWKFYSQAPHQNAAAYQRASRNLQSYLKVANLHDELATVLAHHVDFATTRFGPTHAETLYSIDMLALRCRLLDTPQRAEKWLNAVQAEMRKPEWRTKERSKSLLLMTTHCWVRAGRLKEAEEILDQVLSAEDRKGSKVIVIAEGLGDLAVCRAAHKQYAEAIDLLSKASVTLSAGYEQRHPLVTAGMVRTIYDRLDTICLASGQPKLAETYRKRMPKLLEMAPLPRIVQPQSRSINKTPDHARNRDVLD